MILVIALIIVIAALVQIVLQPLTIFGVLPIIPLLASVWFAIRYHQPMLVLPLMLVAGLVLSFFSLSPHLTIFANLVSAVVTALVLTLFDYQVQRKSRFSLIMPIFAGVLAYVVIVSVPVATNFLPIQLFALVTWSLFINLFVWSTMMVVAEP